MNSKVSSIRSDRKRMRLYKRWSCMQQRCCNPGNKKYHRYGGRGIKLCDEWKSFAAFESWATSNGYDGTLSIDRIDNNGNYEPSNCRWVEPKVNSRNRECTVRYTAFGESKTAGEWIEDSRCMAPSASCITKRAKEGWSHQEAIETPRGNFPCYLTAFGETKSVVSWSVDRRCEITYPALRYRLSHGWSVEDAISQPKANKGPMRRIKA